MKRTKIQITEAQAAALRALAAKRCLPVAGLIRMSIDSFLRSEGGISGDRKRTRARSAAGRFESSLTDISSEHDRYFVEAIGQA